MNKMLIFVFADLLILYGAFVTVSLQARLSQALVCLYWLLGETVFRQASAKNLSTGAHDKGTTNWNLMGVIITNTVPTLVMLTPVDVLTHLQDLGVPFIDPTPLSKCTIQTVLCLMLLGQVLRFTAMSILNESFARTLKVRRDQALETRGPYQFVRHPGYTGNLLMFVGNAVVTSQSLWCIAFVALVFAVVWTHRIEHEEAMLRAHFGEEYERYMQRTPARLLPLIY